MVSGETKIVWGKNRKYTTPFFLCTIHNNIKNIIRHEPIVNGIKDDPIEPMAMDKLWGMATVIITDPRVPISVAWID